MTENICKLNLDNVQILAICRDIELCCAEIYNYYAGLFTHNSEISDLWKKTANEEENHAKQFALAITLHKKGIIENTSIDSDTAETTLKNIKIIYEGVKRNQPSLTDALKISIKLEEKLSDFHTSAVANFVDESFKNMFIAMMKADNYHLGKLQNAYSKILKVDIPL